MKTKILPGLNTETNETVYFVHLQTVPRGKYMAVILDNNFVYGNSKEIAQKESILLKEKLDNKQLIPYLVNSNKIAIVLKRT